MTQELNLMAGDFEAPVSAAAPTAHAGTASIPSALDIPQPVIEQAAQVAQPVTILGIQLPTTEQLKSMTPEAVRSLLDTITQRRDSARSNLAVLESRHQDQLAALERQRAQLRETYGVDTVEGLEQVATKALSEYEALLASCTNQSQPSSAQEA